MKNGSFKTKTNMVSLIQLLAMLWNSSLEHIVGDKASNIFKGRLVEGKFIED